VHNINKELLFYGRNKAEAAEPEYPCCIKLYFIVGNQTNTPKEHE
jgi:hypothetical protein